MHHTFFLAGLAAASTLAAASPLESRQSKCHPSFGGVGVAVVWDQSTFVPREWVPVAVGDSITTDYAEYNTVAFRVEGVTSPTGSYVIKKLGVPANNEVVSVGGGYLNIAYASATDPNQTWEISCDTCGTSPSTTHGLFASGCTIKSVNLGLCAQIVTSPTHAHSPPSFLSQLVTCNAAATNQRFQFWTV
ncbi:hypothetical protein DXG03_002514 [Asterophora parasitica]|uniref:Uncharacterized protein n=1 Tax=Asterophora parasitica TaxID=117018 RepID=A0A9P7G4B9_9AGAR|nr:hypothetical protein DXG03_002514 [Asterophora parasitica]